VRFTPRAGGDPVALGRLAAAALAAVAAGAAEDKGGRRKRAYRLALHGGAVDHLLKVHNYVSLSPWRRVGRSKARLELARAEAIAARGIPTSIPVGVGERRVSGFLATCYALVPWLEDAVDLRRLWERGGDAPAERRAWTRALGALVRRLHDAGIDQRDLAPNNFLWRSRGEPRLVAVDFERARVGRRAVGRRARVRALAKLDRHFAGAPATARWRFALAYAQGDRAAARAWWTAVARAAPRLALRDLRRARRAALRDGRRFERIEVAPDLRGWARRGHGDEARAAIARAMRGAPDSVCVVRALALARRRAAAGAWAAALVLAQRRLAPDPVALVFGRGGTWLVLGPGAPRTPAAAASRAALAVLLDRLGALGTLRRTLTQESFGRAADGRLLLLDPTAVTLGGRPPPVPGRAAARARAAALSGGASPLAGSG
jgi:hypothetical protein